MVLGESVLLIRVGLGLPDKAFIFGGHSDQPQIRLAFRAADKRATFLLQSLLGFSGFLAEPCGLLSVNLRQLQLILRRQLTLMRSSLFACQNFGMSCRRQ